MSGHSKWSKVKHQKATTDVAKAAAFTKATRSIAIAVKEGGGVTDPLVNFRLRLAVEKARSVNMPKENIQRAIDRAGGAESNGLRQVSYEGYGPYGVALYIEAITDNVNRTVSFVKQVLEHAGGSMGTPGSVAYLFDAKGYIRISSDLAYDTILEYGLEAGADDVVLQDQNEICMYTDPAELFAVKTNLEQKGIHIEEVMRIMQPKVMIELSQEQCRKVEALVDQLEAHDDIEQVFVNCQL